MKKMMLAASAAILSLSAASPAMAAKFFNLTAVGTNFNINAQLETGDASNRQGVDGNTGYRIMDITGYVTNNANGNRQTINGLTPVGDYPVNAAPANDNLLLTSAPFFDRAGVSFTTATGGSPFNLYYSGGYFYIRGDDETNRGTFTSVNVTAVPEPATWGMMLVGFGMVGAASRYRRRRAKVTYA